MAEPPDQFPVRQRPRPTANAVTLRANEEQRLRLEMALDMIQRGAIYKKIPSAKRKPKPEEIMIVTNAALFQKEREAILVLLQAAREGKI